MPFPDFAAPPARSGGMPHHDGAARDAIRGIGAPRVTIMVLPRVINVQSAVQHSRPASPRGRSGAMPRAPGCCTASAKEAGRRAHGAAEPWGKYRPRPAGGFRREMN
ncbi:hypothetical protein [Burkholderia ubonensis]|uniref:hypothetical protein n=1 Tax=Burkholderia ubonensis TaxID=101571 RepID=UPI0012F77953|nr:hypothetical protein [Burkholderia ubonensis]